MKTLEDLHPLFSSLYNEQQVTQECFIDLKEHGRPYDVSPSAMKFASCQIVCCVYLDYVYV